LPIARELKALSFERAKRGQKGGRLPFLAIGKF
jgi:hypothetical protein